jgi:hypothetical protein
MKKLNAVTYNRLICQAEEAKELGLDDLAEGVLSCVGDAPKEEKSAYSSVQLKKDIYLGLWKLAADVMSYHDINQVDAERVHKVLETLSDQVIKEVEASLMVSGKVGALEPKLPGETE